MAKQKLDYLVPTAESLVEMSAMLFGDDTSAKPVDTKAEPAYIARYVDPKNAGVAQCYCDMDFAGFSSTKLSMIPADTAKDFIEAGELSDETRGNLYEIMNIYSRLFMDADSAHLKLIALETSDFWLERQAQAEVSFEIVIPDYGTGLLTFNIK